MTVIFTPPPAPPPNVVPIPSRVSDGEEEFDAKTDVYLTWQDALRNWLALFIAWLGTFMGEVEATAEQVESAASAALNAATTALTSSHFKGMWADQSGQLYRPACVKHEGLFWLLLNDLEDVSASEPGVSADWTSRNEGEIVEEVSISTHMQTRARYVATAPGITLTVPATLLTGDTLALENASDGDVYVVWSGHTVKNQTPESPMRIPRRRGLRVTFTGSTLA